LFTPDVVMAGNWSGADNVGIAVVALPA